MLTRAPRKGRSRGRLAKTFNPLTPALNWTATINAGKVRMTLVLPFSFSAIPLSITVQGVAPIGITQVSTLVFDLTYTATVVTTNVLVVPANVPEVRGQAGGCLAAGTKTF